jgi:conjugal transfer/entry exclusion protein
MKISLKKKLIIIIILLAVAAVSVVLFWPNEARNSVDTANNAFNAIFQVVDTVKEQKPSN